MTTYEQAGVRPLDMRAFAATVGCTGSKFSGFFASVVPMAMGCRLGITTDGVGTKALIAQQVAGYATLGYDAVAANVNDLLCVGAVPSHMVDTIQADRYHSQDHILQSIAAGLAGGAMESGVQIVGGEIAQLDDMLTGIEVSGTAIGMIPPNRGHLDGSEIQEGEVLIGLPSSGLHTNGYSLARKVFGSIDGGYEQVLQGERVLDHLARRSWIYTKPIAAVWEAGVVPKGIAHISGEGLRNLLRFNSGDCWFSVSELPTPPPIFGAIQAQGDISVPEMFNTFNMGVGMVLVVSTNQAAKTLKACRQVGHQAFVMGAVVNGTTGTGGRVIVGAEYNVFTDCLTKEFIGGKVYHEQTQDQNT